MKSTSENSDTARKMGKHPYTAHYIRDFEHSDSLSLTNNPPFFSINGNPRTHLLALRYDNITP